MLNDHLWKIKEHLKKWKICYFGKCYNSKITELIIAELKISNKPDLTTIAKKIEKT